MQAIIYIRNSDRRSISVTLETNEQDRTTMNLLIPGDIRSGKVPSRVLHNAVLPRSDPREYIVYKVFTRQDVSQLDSDFVLQSPSPPTHINPYQPIS